MLEVKNISKKFINKNIQKHILENVNFEIAKGEIVSLIGSSGCGKTTLASIIAGYLKQDKGEVVINGEVVNKPGRNRVVINQENDLFNWMSVYENMLISTKDKSKIEHCLYLTKLSDYKKYYPQELSGGMKKRLSLARALAAGSDFLIMDEPFSSQDIKVKEELYKDIISTVKDVNLSMLLITHDIDEAIFLSDRIMILGGSPATIIKEYSKPLLDFKKDNSLIDKAEEELKKQLKIIGYNINL